LAASQAIPVMLCWGLLDRLADKLPMRDLSHRAE
jgi:hypothetical protein